MAAAKDNTESDWLHWLKPWAASGPGSAASSSQQQQHSSSSPPFLSEPTTASSSRLSGPKASASRPSPGTVQSVAPQDSASLSPATLSYLYSSDVDDVSPASAFLSKHTSGPVLGIPLTALGLGFFVGLYTSASKASLVFMAENAHRRPDTVQGWYFYNKTKNYKVLLAGLKGGARTAARMTAWATAWTVLEQGIGKWRETDGRDMIRGRWIDGSLAGTGIAMVATLTYRLSRPIIPRTLLMGMLAGGTVGALRDVQARLGAKREEEEAALAT